MLVPPFFVSALLRFVRDSFPGFVAAVERSPAGATSSSEVEALFESLSDETGERDLGLRFGASAHASEAYGVVGMLVRSARTVGEGLLLAHPYARLFGSNPGPPVERTREGLVLRDDPPEPSAERQRHFHEALFASYVHVLRAWTGSEFSAIRVRFAHQTPPSLLTHRLVFQDTDLGFGASVPQIVLPHRVWGLELRSADPVTQRFLLAVAEAELGALPTSSVDLPEQVRGLARAELRRSGQVPSLTTVAEWLAIGERTLQRRLTACGLSFRALIDAERQQETLRLVAESGLGQDSIAMRVGLTDPRSLRRAVKRWTGATPGALRRRAR